jgi:long-chain acyl-CoA synthetase
MATFKPKYETLNDIFQHSVSAFADRPLFGTRQHGAWVWMTYAEFGRSVDAMRSALADLGVGAGDRVAIIANNRPEWAIAAYATYGLGAVFVAMYEAQAEPEWLYILRDSGAKILFVPGQVTARRILTHGASLPALEKIVVLEGPTEPEMVSYPRALDEGRRRALPVRPTAGSDVACFIYTSGTTGNPKGVRLTHANIAYNVSAIHEFFPVDASDRSVCFLPWAHVFGQTVELHGLFSLGASLGLSESVDKLIDNIAEVKPTLLVSVPRIFNRIYDTLHQKVNSEGGWQKRLFFAGLDNAKQRKTFAARRQTSGVSDFKHLVFDRVVFSKVRERFGGRLKYAISGGAALSKEVAEFIDDLGITVFEGYGLSETSPIVSANSPGSRKLGSVGKCIPGVRVEIDTAVTGDPKNGEILVFGHNVMAGYHNLPEENARVFVERNGERGLRTGDMGFVDGEGFLHITGRVKEQYKLLNGRYVVPTPLEEDLKLSSYLSNVMVFGDNREYNVAVVIPDFVQLTKWARENGITGDAPSLVANERVRQLIASQLESYSTKFKPYEKVKKFVIGTVDFTTDNRMLTPSLKVKRTEVLKHYGEALDALYGSCTDSGARARRQVVARFVAGAEARADAGDDHAEHEEHERPDDFARAGQVELGGVAPRGKLVEQLLREHPSADHLADVRLDDALERPELDQRGHQETELRPERRLAVGVEQAVEDPRQEQDSERRPDAGRNEDAGSLLERCAEGSVRVAGAEHVERIHDGHEHAEQHHQIRAADAGQHHRASREEPAEEIPDGAHLLVDGHVHVRTQRGEPEREREARDRRDRRASRPGLGHPEHDRDAADREAREEAVAGPAELGRQRAHVGPEHRDREQRREEHGGDDEHRAAVQAHAGKVVDAFHEEGVDARGEQHRAAAHARDDRREAHADAAHDRANLEPWVGPVAVHVTRLLFGYGKSLLLVGKLAHRGGVLREFGGRTQRPRRAFGLWLILRTMTDSGCSHCGASIVAGLVACTFCATPYAGAPPGIDCPKCHDDNHPSRVACARCGTSFMRTCLFCNGVASITHPQCVRCGELFEGAELRKQQRDDAQRQQQMIGLAASGIAAIGAVAASPMGQGLFGQLMNEIKDEIGKG